MKELTDTPDFCLTILKTTHEPDGHRVFPDLNSFLKSTFAWQVKDKMPLNDGVFIVYDRSKLDGEFFDQNSHSFQQLDGEGFFFIFLSHDQCLYHLGDRSDYLCSFSNFDHLLKILDTFRLPPDNFHEKVSVKFVLPLALATDDIDDVGLVNRFIDVSSVQYLSSQNGRLKDCELQNMIDFVKDPSEFISAYDADKHLSCIREDRQYIAVNANGDISQVMSRDTLVAQRSSVVLEIPESILPQFFKIFLESADGTCCRDLVTLLQSVEGDYVTLALPGTLSQIRFLMAYNHEQARIRNLLSQRVRGLGRIHQDLYLEDMLDKLSDSAERLLF